MAEEKKIENAVYEYDVLEERTERRPATVTPYEREICQHMEGLFPHRVTRVYREIDSEFLSVNVFVMKAPTKKDFHVLYTTGMDLCQYFEHKKLKGYADFFNSSSSFCCGVI